MNTFKKILALVVLAGLGLSFMSQAEEVHYATNVEKAKEALFITAAATASAFATATVASELSLSDNSAKILITGGAIIAAIGCMYKWHKQGYDNIDQFDFIFASLGGYACLAALYLAAVCGQLAGQGIASGVQAAQSALQ